MKAADLYGTPSVNRDYTVGAGRPAARSAAPTRAGKAPLNSMWAIRASDNTAVSRA